MASAKVYNRKRLQVGTCVREVRGRSALETWSQQQGLNSRGRKAWSRCVPWMSATACPHPVFLAWRTSATGKLTLPLCQNYCSLWRNLNQSSHDDSKSCSQQQHYRTDGDKVAENQATRRLVIWSYYPQLYRQKVFKKKAASLNSVPMVPLTERWEAPRGRYWSSC